MDFWSLGMGEPIPVAGASGKGAGNLLDRIVAELPSKTEGEPDEHEIRVAVVGKPNVGKSSFVNKMFGVERVVVTDVPGTTRDPVDTPMVYHGRQFVFVDTAGLRRQARVKDSLEYYSALRSARVLQDADVSARARGRHRAHPYPGPEGDRDGLGGRLPVSCSWSTNGT